MTRGMTRVVASRSMTAMTSTAPTKEIFLQWWCRLVQLGVAAQSAHIAGIFDPLNRERASSARVQPCHSEERTDATRGRESSLYYISLESGIREHKLKRRTCISKGNKLRAHPSPQGDLVKIAKGLGPWWVQIKCDSVSRQCPSIRPSLTFGSSQSEVPFNIMEDTIMHPIRQIRLRAMVEKLSLELRTVESTKKCK